MAPSHTYIPATFNGWSTAVQLTNGDVTLIAVPEIGGRIMAYHHVGGPNVVYENPVQFGAVAPITPPNQHINYGGCKLWAAPQRLFVEPEGVWPPNAFWENGRNRVNMPDPVTLELIGPDDPRSIVQFTRRFILPARGARITIEHCMRNVGRRSTARAIWAINPMARPSLALAPKPREAAQVWGTHTELWQQRDDTYVCDAAGDTATKLFVHVERPWCAGLRDGWLWVIWGEPLYDKACPHGEASVEIYLDRTFIELEIVAPECVLHPGETTTYTMYWDLRRLGDNTAAAAEKALAGLGLLARSDHNDNKTTAS